jgi:rod shape-determining protein MreD
MSSKRSSAIALLILTAFLLQTVVVAPLSLPFAGPDLVLLATVAAFVYLSPGRAAILGFAVGLLLDLTPPLDGTAGLWALTLTASGYVVGLFASGGRAASPLIGMGLTALGSAGAVVFFSVIGLIVGDERVTASVLTYEVPGTGLWNLLLSPFALAVMQRITRLDRRIEIFR